MSASSAEQKGEYSKTSWCVCVIVSDLRELSELPQSLTLLNKGICSNINVQLVNVLFVNAHQHHMVEPVLAHGVLEMIFQSAHS